LRNRGGLYLREGRFCVSSDWVRSRTWMVELATEFQLDGGSAGKRGHFVVAGYDVRIRKDRVWKLLCCE
jgi:hypothetical protein